MVLFRKNRKKPSAGLSKKQKFATVKAARAGKDIGKKGKIFSKIAAGAAERYGSAERGKSAAASVMWRNIRRGK